VDTPRAVVTIPQCAVHEDAHSTQSCARCGNYACPLCLDPVSVFPEYCAACRAREGATKIAWERGDAGAFRRFWRTARDILLRPGLTFDRAEPGSPWRALSYAAIVGALNGLGLVLAVLTAFAIYFYTRDLDRSPILRAYFVIFPCTALVLGPLMSAIQSVALSFVYALIYHLGVRIAGGRGRFGASLWATAYLHAIWLPWLVLLPLHTVPLLGNVASIVMLLAVLLWTSIRLTQIGQRYHELSFGRAVATAWFPAVLGVAIVLALVAAAVALEVARLRS
jgi:hypothetical protein